MISCPIGNGFKMAQIPNTASRLNIFEPTTLLTAIAFELDHFCGVRAGLFCYATKQLGGMAAFAHFKHDLLGVDERSE